MGEKRHELENLKKQNPFRVPEGYMENLTDRIMSQLPEKTTEVQTTKSVSLVTRLRPWLLGAAAIAGIGFFINVFIHLDESTSVHRADSLWIQSDHLTGAVSEARASIDEEYLEYLEAKYSNYILEEELADSE